MNRFYEIPFFHPIKNCFSKEKLWALEPHSKRVQLTWLRGL